MEVKFPHVRVKLVGEDGNAFSIIGRTVRALEKAKVPKADIEAYKADVMSGDYDHLLQTTIKTVDTF